MTAQTEALRNLADFIDTHPELNIGTTPSQGSVYIQDDDLLIFAPYRAEAGTEKGFVRTIIRAFGGVWDKDPSGESMTFKQKGILDYFDTTIFVNREAVCERKLVGMEDVEVPAQKAVKAHVESVPVYEWECGSLLAPTTTERELVDA